MNAQAQIPAILASWQTDPGHGWLVVNEAQLAAVGMTRDDFSPFSYAYFERIERGGAAPGRWVYALEEDLDAAMFIRAAERQGIPFSATSIHSDSDHYIRTWQPINGRSWEQWRAVRDDIVGRYAQH